jgi:Domain of unknown function (DUF1707)/Cell wall-active antibiotics response 4TMS YvqF
LSKVIGVSTPALPPVSDHDRERAAALLQQACGAGRITLEEFSGRVGAVWAADSAAELEKATADLAPEPMVGTAQPVERVVTVFSENKRHGRWRLLPQGLRTQTVFGSTELDLRDALTGSDVIEIGGACVFGEVKVIVPEGVDVDLVGATMFSSRQLNLAPVPRVQGTPRVRVAINAWFSSVQVTSAPYRQLGR